MILKQRALFVAVPFLVLTACGCRRADQPPPAVTVIASYPGASAEVVASTVATPVEQQVAGAEGLVHLWSRCGSDGSYTLTAVFKPGTDLNIAQVLVQNREALTEPLLPEEVKQGGIAVKKNGNLLLFVNLFSPDDRYDTLYLSNYAAIYIKDELARVAGVGDIVLFGERDIRFRIWLDPDKLAARNLTTADVIQALREQKVQLQADRAAGDKEAALQVPAAALGRLAEPEQLADIVVKTDGGGAKVHLKDVARVEAGTSGDSRVSLDGKPSVVLALYQLPGSSATATATGIAARMKELKSHFPEGLDYALAFDFARNLEAPDRATTPGYLVVDVVMPAGAAPARTDEALRHCAELLRKTPGVQHVLALADQPFDGVRGRPCLLAQLAPAAGQADRERLLKDVRTRLGEQVPEALLRLRDLSGAGRFPRCGYPIDLAVSGPEAGQVRKLASKLAERLEQGKQLTDVLANPESMPQPQLYVDIDREKMRALGVSLQDVNTTLQAALGLQIPWGTDRPERGRTLHIQAAAQFRNRAEDLKLLMVRNSKGEMVPLSQLATVQDITAPLVLDRLDGRPMVEVTANPASGVTLAQARALCETTAEEVRKELQLSAEYRLTWLDQAPALK
jgi:multidrug efflux pump subunit AcrB